MPIKDYGVNNNQLASAGIVAAIGFAILCAFPSWMLAGALMAFIYYEISRRGSSL